MNRFVVLGVAALTAVLATPALAQLQQPTRQAATPVGSMQGEQASWINDPYMHAFYDLTVQTFGDGRTKVNEAAFTEKAFAIFRDFAKSRGVAPEMMIEHLKLAPAEAMTVVEKNPSVLKSYTAFSNALFNPQ